MRILQYTAKHNDFRDRLRTFFEREVIPNVDQWEKDCIVPKSIWKKMGREGFLCTSVSPEYGGLGGDFIYSVIMAEEIAMTNHMGLSAQLHSDIVVPYIETYGSQEQKKKFLPGCVSGDIITAVAMTEPDAGSDLASMTTTAVEDGDEAVINGSKIFITNGINCDLAVVAVKGPQLDNSHKAISLYLVEDGTPGFEKGRRLEKLGWHSQDTTEFFFTNCRIPRKNRLGEKGAGFLMLMEKLQQERLVSSLTALVSAESIMDWTTDYCRNTNTSGKPLSNSQAIRFALVEMATDVKILRTFVEKLVADHMEKKDVRVETSMAKYWSSDMLNRIANRCLDLIGNFATKEKCPIVRGWRDARLMPIFAGTNEIMKGIIANSMNL